MCVPADSRPDEELMVVLTVPSLERVRWSRRGGWSYAAGV